MEGGHVRAAHAAISSLAQMQERDVPRNRRIDNEQTDGFVAGPMMGSVGTRWTSGGIMEDKLHGGTGQA